VCIIRPLLLLQQTCPKMWHCESETCMVTVALRFSLVFVIILKEHCWPPFRMMQEVQCISMAYCGHAYTAVLH
jgi:hypothetical protein